MKIVLYVFSNTNTEKMISPSLIFISFYFLLYGFKKIYKGGRRMVAQAYDSSYDSGALWVEAEGSVLIWASWDPGSAILSTNR